METQLQSIRLFLQILDHEASLDSINNILQKLGQEPDISEAKAWERILLTACNELRALILYIQTADPIIVRESENSEKCVIVNHMNLEQTSVAASLIELVSVWGLVPFLSFSIPLESRKKEIAERIGQLKSSVVQELSKTYLVPISALKALYECVECRELHQMAIECAMVDMIPGFIKFGFEKHHLSSSDAQWCNSSFKKAICNPAIEVSSLARILLLHLSLKPQNPVTIRVLSSSLYMLICERSNGFTGTLSALLDTSSGVVNMEAVSMASKTIANPPERIQMEGYFTKLVPQFLVILRTPHSSKLDKFLTAISEIFSIWSLSHPTLTTQLWLLPLVSPFLPFIALYIRNQRDFTLDPLHKYLHTSQSSHTSIERKAQKPKIQLLEELPLEKPLNTHLALKEWKLPELESWNSRDGLIAPYLVLENTISNLTMFLLAVGDGEYLNHFEPIIPVVVNLYALSVGQKSRVVMEKETKMFLERFFKLCHPDLAIRLLNYLSFHNDFDWRALYSNNSKSSCCRYEFSEIDGKFGIYSYLLSENPGDDIISDVRATSDQLVQLLKILDGDLAGVFFLKLLEELWITMTASKSLLDGNQALSSDSMEESMKNFQLLAERQIKIMHILLPLIEQIGPSMLKNTVQICVFVKNMLENDGEEEIQALSLSILKELLETRLVSRSEADILLFDMLTPLKLLFESNNEFISGLSQHCYEEIIKFSAEPSDESDAGSGGKEMEEEGDKKRKRWWVLDPHASSVEEALKMIATPLVPIRAGGLIQLRRFLLREDLDAMERLPLILDTFTQHLANEDSYVYLGAIQGLSAIADVQFSLAMPKLAEQYQNSKRSIEIRLNVGESILQVARRLSSALPKYAHDFFSLLLFTSQKDPQALMRASSLSNIAELCELLRYALLPYIEEIMAMVYDILLIEKDDHVRRGCVNLIKQLFKGLEKDTIAVIPDHIKRIIPLLQTIHQSDRDNVLREHARIALELYESGIEALIAERTSAPQFLDPQGFYSSLRFVK